MGIYREAADALFKRQVGIYGLYKMMHIANASGYELDRSGNLISVKSEKSALDMLLYNLERELGPIAVIGIKVALMRFFAKKECMEPKAEEYLGETSLYSDRLRHYIGDQKSKNKSKNMSYSKAKAETGAYNPGSVYNDHIFMLDSELRILDVSGYFLKEYRSISGPVIGRTICELGLCASTCSTGSEAKEGDCPVTKALNNMSPDELRILVDGKLQQWRVFPFVTGDVASKKALVHIMESPEEIAA